MKNLFILADAINFIENNLTSEFTLEETAAHCFCSLSALQKAFRYALHCSVKEYVCKRRLTDAARELLTTEHTVTETAMKYCYGSSEAFSRAFSRIWHASPSDFRRTRRFSGLFPRMDFTYEGGNFMPNKRFDISELYDIMIKNEGTYVVCFDINGLMPINDVSRLAGDMAISESLRRIDAETPDSMPLFRIGGDEFVLVTLLSDKSEVEKTVEAVFSHNREPIVWEGHEIPLSLSAAAVRIVKKDFSYATLFSNLRDYTIHSRTDREHCNFIN